MFWRLEGEAEHEQSLKIADENNLEFAIATQVGVDVSEDFRLSSGLGLRDDRISTDGALTSSGFIEMARSSGAISASLRGTAELKLHADELDDNANSVVSELNYHKFSAASEVKLLPKARLSPFLRVGVSTVDYTNNKELFRDARSLTTTAGISARILGNLRLDIGGRYNARKTSRSWVSDTYLDANLEWDLSDEFKLAASVTREYEETDDDGYFVDAKTYALELNWAPNSDLELGLEASLSDERNVGGLTKSREYELNAEGQYALNDNMNFIVASSVKLAEDQDENGQRSEYEQFTVRSGVEVKF